MLNDWLNICQMLLSMTLYVRHIRGSRLSLTWLGSQFPGVDDNVDEKAVMRYRRAYILQLIGGHLLSDNQVTLCI